MAKGIYLDNSAVARPADKAVSATLPFFLEKWGSFSSPHQMGQELLPSIEESYQAIYRLLNAKESDDFVLTSSGAEAVNHVFFSAYLDVVIPTGKNQFILSQLDEAPAILSAERLNRLGCVVKTARADACGRITPQAIADVLTPRVALVSLSWANGLTGVIHPVAEIASLCQERGILLHLDATHVLGKLYYDLEDIGADFITFNGETLHAPKGTGGLYIKTGVKCSPFIVGGLEQGGYRAGSLNTPSLIALGAAAREALEARDFVCGEVARLRNRLEEGLLRAIPAARVFYREQEERLPHCSIVGFPGVANEAFLYALNRKGVFASIGGGSFQQASLLMQATGIDETLASTCVSFSLSRETTEEEIDGAIRLISETYDHLRKLSLNILP